MISLGAAVQGITFSDSEWERIASSAKSGGLPGKILKKHALQSKVFQIVSRKMQIAGQSVGRPEHTAKAIDLVITHLSDGKESTKRKAYCDIYLDSVVYYVQNTLPKLNNLLQQAKIPEKKYSTKELFEILATKVSEFDVSADEVRELYEFWGFERDENIEELLKKCAADNIDGRQNKRLNALDEQISEIRQQIVSQRDASSALNLGIEGDQKKSSQLRADLDNQIRISQEAVTRIDKRIVELEQLLTVNRKSSEKFQQDNVQEFKIIRAELEEVKKKLSQLPASITSQIASFKDELTTSLKAENETQRADFFSRSNHRIETFLSKLSEEQKTKSVETHYVSPLQVLPPQFRPQSFKLSDENQFLNIWQGRLQADEGIALCLESVAIYHALFSTAYSIVLEDERLARSWLKTLGWESSSFSAVASPAWLSESDWKDGASFIFAKDDTGSMPKSLFIHNYDLGVPQAYLIPTLKMWSLTPRFRLSKIFLIASESNEAEPAAEVLEHSIYLPEADLTANRTLPSSSRLHVRRLDSREGNHTGVKPEHFLSWLGQELPDLQMRSDAEELTKWSGIHLPRGIRMLSSRIQQALQKYFNEDESKQVAAYHCICPWISAKHGDDKKDEFFGMLKSFSAKAINY